jgi:hypothetical protein
MRKDPGPACMIPPGEYSKVCDGFRIPHSLWPSCYSQRVAQSEAASEVAILQWHRVWVAQPAERARREEVVRRR